MRLKPSAMKPLKMAWVVAIAAGSLLGCTNDEMDPEFETPVSYTHLTLPTIYTV